MKCPYWHKAACSVDHTHKDYAKYRNVHRNCPKNVGRDCNIVPKMVKVKGEAWINYKTGEINGVKAKKEWAMFLGKQVPCTILIDEKYLNKLSKLICPNCRKKGGVVSKGRAYGNIGKLEYACTCCDATWQYGYGDKGKL